MKVKKHTKFFAIMLLLIGMPLSVYCFFRPTALIENPNNGKIYLVDYYSDIEQTGAGITLTPSEDDVDTAAILAYLSTCQKYRAPLLASSSNPLKNGDCEIVFGSEDTVGHLILGSQNRCFFDDGIFQYRILNSEIVYQDIYQMIKDNIEQKQNSPYV